MRYVTFFCKAQFKLTAVEKCSAGFRFDMKRFFWCRDEPSEI